MSKRPETKRNNDRNTNALETIETVALDAVTGGCSACGCAQPDPAAAQQQQLATSWPRR